MEDEQGHGDAPVAVDDEGGGDASAGEPSAGGDAAAAEVVEADGPGLSGPSWAKAIALALALAVLGFGVGVFTTRDRPPGDGSVDVGFTHDMHTHHEQALEMATLVVARGESPIVRSFARDILLFQSYEIGIMEQKLADWGLSPRDRPDEAMRWMNMPVPVERMPGLLSDEQMDQLRAARGAELDALFLELMAFHHRGGIHMAVYAGREASDPDLRELARRMARTQAIEINEYRMSAEAHGFDVDIEPATVPTFPD